MASNPHLIGSSNAAAWGAGYRAGQIHGHQGGVKAGRQLERDAIGEQLILMAQDYGHAQFVFTADDLEALNSQVSDISSTLAGIETLR